LTLKGDSRIQSIDPFHNTRFWVFPFGRSRQGPRRIPLKPAKAPREFSGGAPGGPARS